MKGSSFTFVVPKGGDRMWEDENGVVHREINKRCFMRSGPQTRLLSVLPSMRSSRRHIEEAQGCCGLEPAPAELKNRPTPKQGQL